MKLILFQSIHYVMKAESNLLKNKFKFKVIPTPKSISSECGMCIEFKDFELLNDIKKILDNEDIYFEIKDV
ncbi:MAG: DUF3343 domain-containing protein [Pseudomonadota bacterium]